MKNEKNIFTSFAILALANSIAYLFFTERSIGLLGGEVVGVSLLMTKYYGAIALGSSIVVWLLRGTDNLQFKRVMLLGIFISMLVSTGVGIYGSWNNWIENFDWLFILIDLALTVWALYLILSKHTRKP